MAMIRRWAASRLRAAEPVVCPVLTTASTVGRAVEPHEQARWAPESLGRGTTVVRVLTLRPEPVVVVVVPVRLAARPRRAQAAMVATVCRYLSLEPRSTTEVALVVRRWVARLARVALVVGRLVSRRSATATVAQMA